MVAGPRRRKAACMSTAGKAEEHKAIAQKTGHGFMGELRKKQKTAKTTVFKTFDGFYGSRYQEKRQKKWWGIYNQSLTHSPFCKRLIINHSQVTHKLQMVIHSFSELHSPRLR